jgi:hypothetical protein
MPSDTILIWRFRILHLIHHLQIIQNNLPLLLIPVDILLLILLTLTVLHQFHPLRVLHLKFKGTAPFCQFLDPVVQSVDLLLFSDQLPLKLAGVQSLAQSDLLTGHVHAWGLGKLHGTVHQQGDLLVGFGVGVDGSALCGGFDVLELPLILSDLDFALILLLAGDMQLILEFLDPLSQLCIPPLHLFLHFSEPGLKILPHRLLFSLQQLHPFILPLLTPLTFLNIQNLRLFFL